MSAGRRGVIFGLIVVLLTVLGVAAGYFGAKAATTTYTSSAVLLWDPSSLRYSDASAYVPDSASLVVQVQAQTARILSDDVIDPASKKLGITPDDLRTIATVSLGSNSSEIVVSATGATAASATATTRAIVSAYVDETQDAMGAQYAAKADALQAPIDALTARVASLDASSSLAVSLSSQLSDDIAQQVSLRAQAEQPVTPLSVAQSASTPMSPSSASSATLSVVGGGVGFLIGIGIIALLMLRGFPRRLRKRPAVVPSVSGHAEVA